MSTSYEHKSFLDADPVDNILNDVFFFRLFGKIIFVSSQVQLEYRWNSENALHYRLLERQRRQ